MNGESQFGDESSNPLAGIAPPIQAKSVPAARADEPRVNNTNIGQVHRFSDQEVNTIFSNQIHITGYGPDFTMIGDVVAKGSLVLLPSVFLHWKPRTWQEVTSESLAILSFLHPVPDLVLFGTGLKYQAPSNSLHHFMKTFNIKYDIMATTNAMGTYNILNEEGRRVAAFIIPLTEQEHDTYKSRENAPLF
jgi:NADH dehydrogenase [ubiquinone] 1 alpha subcomplex assembly factor 3